MSDVGEVAPFFGEQPPDAVGGGVVGGQALAPLRWGRVLYLKWSKTAVAKGLPAKLRFHDLRHASAAWLITANAPAKAIQTHLGHSSFKITMDTYGHQYEDASDHVANAMNAAFAGPGGPESANLLALRG